MAEVRYNNTLVSGRADETLTYSRYVKGLETGKSVEAELSELRSEISGISAGDKHDNAFDGDYLYVEDFAKGAEDLSGTSRYDAVKQNLNDWLEDVEFNINTDQRYMGRCKLTCDGVNIECYNYILGWASQSGCQMLQGMVSVDSEGQIDYDSTSVNILYRYHTDAAWGKWMLLDNSMQRLSVGTDELDGQYNKFDALRNGKNQVVYELTHNGVPIGTCLMFVDASGAWMHQVVFGSFGEGSSFDTPSWVGGSGRDVFRVFHRGITSGSKTWGKWSQCGGTGIRDLIMQVAQAVPQVESITVSEVDTIWGNN